MGTSLSAGCGKAPTLASNTYNNDNPIAITAADRQRRYILSVPTDYDNTKPYNLVIAWHQLDGNDKLDSLLTQASKEEKNPALKEYATKTLPTIQKHLDTAKKFDKLTGMSKPLTPVDTRAQG